MKELKCENCATVFKTKDIISYRHIKTTIKIIKINNNE